ncbi:TetR/AcrR family transcriptional regulator [Planobispora takensis]|uniref:TetR family transcriptional regulator n=1 Tax=Planobispora takensis TaxID=1367882 RepID=A0A8J3T3K3_9ACTN|nr:TetR/AcrR family transcriptional regulator [Planobispora takensis]GII04265.1 TetR family transcriptional regulator [Planobispora takensis]
MGEVSGPRRSAETRLRIVRAAHELFVACGYAGTTFQEIASAAGVSVQTVYFHYGSKSRLLRHVVDVASAGDEEPVPLADRPWFAELEKGGDPVAVVRRWVHEAGIVLVRVAPILAVVRDAAAADSGMAAQWARSGERRRTAHGAFVSVLAGLRALRPGLTVERAVDAAVALLSPELFLVVTRECGWSTAGWEEWAAGHLAHDLLPVS